jgi:predicted nucleic acid-binding protein
MKIIVDTNIIFSVILNSNSTIGDLIFNSDAHFEFYSCNYMRYEIEKHRDRLLKISKLSEERLDISYFQVLSKIKFINDIDFEAFSKFMKTALWTGDKILYKGLTKHGFKKLVNTTELFKIRNHKIKPTQF